MVDDHDVVPTAAGDPPAGEGGMTVPQPMSTSGEAAIWRSMDLPGMDGDSEQVPPQSDL